MLNENIIDQLREFSGEEDNALWAQGDILNENEITKDEIKRLALILQQSPAKLAARQWVAAENPIDYRKSTYSWALYAIFTKISNRNARYTAMFSRTEWTLTEAKEIARSFNPKTQEQNKLTGIERSTLKVGNVSVKAKLDPKGNLTLYVSLGAERVCEVYPQTVNTRIVFPA